MQRLSPPAISPLHTGESDPLPDGPARSVTSSRGPAADDRLAELFDSHQQEHLDAETLERALASMLDRYPQAPVVAVSVSGVFVEMPESIALRGNPILRGRSGLDNMNAEDRAALIGIWDRVLAEGAARCVLRPEGLPELLYHAIDLRASHGVILGMVIRANQGDEAPSPTAYSLPTGVPRFTSVRKNEMGVITKIDEALSEILGWTPEEIEGRRSLEFVHPDDHTLAIDNWVQMLTHPGPARRVRHRMRRKDDSWVWFEVTNHNLLHDPDHRCVIGEMVDISDEMAAHEALRAREQLLDRLAEAVPVGLFQIDTERRIVYTNDRLHEILGIDPTEFVCDQLSSVIEEDRRELEDAIERVLLDGSHADIEVSLRTSDHDAPRSSAISLRALTHEDGTISGAIACVADVTESTRLRDELARQATFDELTGCHNRASIMRSLQADISSGRRKAERAVMFVDLDRFKEVNDNHGHAAGDALLRTVAQRLRGVVRDDDLVGRIGGDEFLVVCANIGGPERAMQLAERLARALRESGSIVCPEGVGYQASIGVAWSGGSTTSAEALVAQADKAMYESKLERTGQPKLARLGTDAAEIVARRVQPTGS